MRLHPFPLGLRTVILLAFSGVFAVWLASAFMFVSRMSRVDTQAAALRAQVLNNEHLLSTVSTETLLSAVYLRDVLLDPSPANRASFEGRLGEIRTEVDGAVSEYVPLVEAESERRQWERLQRELRAYWDSMPSTLTLADLHTQADARALLRESVVPRRESIIRLAADIHDLGRRGLEQARQELEQERQTLRQRAWQISSVAALVGMGIALLATRHVGRLQVTIRGQQVRDEQQKVELARLSSRLMETQEQERRRIARELHDDVGQALGAIKLELASAERQLSAGSPAHLLDEARAITDQALQAVRDVSQVLHPSMLDDLGLPDTVDWYLKGFERRSTVRTQLTVDGIAGRLPQDVAVCAYRVIQEATTNISRHAEATVCRVTLTARPGAIEIVIEDDGRGFDSVATGRRGLGLVSVRERVAGLGGRMALDSRPGRGTRMSIELPISGDDHDDTADTHR